MKVLSLHQPWASLIALGIKTIETRSWKAPASLIGERIAIHAAKRQADFAAMKTVVVENIDAWNAWYAAGLVSEDGSMDHMPYGAIVATARLKTCAPMVDFAPDHEPDWPHVCIDNRPDSLVLLYPGSEEPSYGDDITGQFPYGDFRSGRWAWLLDDVQPLAEPVPFRGGQGLSRSWVAA